MIINISMNNYIMHDMKNFFARRKNALFAVKDSNVTQMQVTHDILPTYHGEMNAFVLEILAMRDDMRPHWSYDFLVAAFECFPHLEYCAIVLPFSHPCHQFLQYFMVFLS